MALGLAACPEDRDDDDDAGGTGAPVIEHSPVETVQEGSAIDLLAAVTVPAPAGDDDDDATAATPTVSAFYRSPGSEDWSPLPMSAAAEDAASFAASIPAEAVRIGELAYYIEATAGTASATHPDGAPSAFHVVYVSALPLPSPEPVRARFVPDNDSIELSWTPPVSGAFVGYTVTADLGDGSDPVTVCSASTPDAGCSVPAGGVYDVRYATWTVSVADDSGGGSSATGRTDNLHLWLATWAKETSAEDPLPWGTEAGDFNLPFGIAASAERIAVVEQGNHRVQHFTLGGVFQGFAGAGGGSGAAGTADGEFSSPHDAAVGPSGELFVADYSNARVQVLHPETLAFQRAFGELGEGDGQLRFPVGLAFDAAGTLHVAESTNGRVSMFDSSGNFLGTYGEIADHTLESPYRIVYLPWLDAVAVADRAEIYVHALSGGEDATWPVAGLEGDAVVGGMAVTRWDELLVAVDDPVATAASSGHRIVKLDAAGQEIGGWGAWGAEDGQFFRPVDCAVSPNGDVLVADALNHRVQIFGP
jgi:hypothetical protein